MPMLIYCKQCILQEVDPTVTFLLGIFSRKYLQQQWQWADQHTELTLSKEAEKERKREPLQSYPYIFKKNYFSLMLSNGPQ